MHELVLWVQQVFLPKLGLVGLFLVTAADTSFVSLPELCDLLVVTGSANNPADAWKLVLATALGSVAGCSSLYEVARRGGEKVAVRFVSPTRLLWAENLLTRFGVFAIAIPALSPPPMPFKGFVLAAGIFRMPRAQFALAVLIARGIRFLVWALLGVFYGDEAVGWLKDFDVWTKSHPAVVITGVAIVTVAALAVWLARRGRKSPAAIIETR